METNIKIPRWIMTGIIYWVVYIGVIVAEEHSPNWYMFLAQVPALLLLFIVSYKSLES